MNIFFRARRPAIEASNFDNVSSIDTAVQPRVVFLDVATSSGQELSNRCCFVELEQEWASRIFFVKNLAWKVAVDVDTYPLYILLNNWNTSRSGWWTIHSVWITGNCTNLSIKRYKANEKGDATSFLVDGMADCSEVSDDTESSRTTNGVPRQRRSLNY